MNLYRYSRVTDRLIDYFNDNMLYFKNPLNFNDPFECDLCTVDIGINENIDQKYYEYTTMLESRLNYVAKKINQIGARITDYASSDTHVTDRYYYNKESELYFNEYKALVSEIKLLESCPAAKRKSSLFDAWAKKKEQVISSLGVVCFRESRSNILMWSHYADSHKGVCLIYDSEERPIKRWKNFKFYKIKYDVNRQIDVLTYGFEKAFYALLTTKSIDWEYEKEHRLITIRGPGYQKAQMGSLKGIVLGSRIKDNNKDILNKFYSALKGLEAKRVNLSKLEYYIAEKDPTVYAVKVNKLLGLVDVSRAIGIAPELAIHALQS